MTSVYMINTDFAADGASRWDQLSHDGPIDAMWPLFDDVPLADRWTPLQATLWPGEAQADLLYFDGTHAARQRVIPALADAFGGDVELLPLRTRTESFSVIHPLRLMPLSSAAEWEQMAGGNIRVFTYAFDESALSSATCFRVQQPPGAPGAPHAGTVAMFVTQRTRDRLVQLGITGIACEQVWPRDERRSREVRTARPL